MYIYKCNHKIMCPFGYHNNGLVETYALGHMG